MEKFEEQLLDILEVDKINDEDILEEFEAWDSLAIISIIAIANSSFNKTITVAEVKNAKNIKGLKELLK